MCVPVSEMSQLLKRLHVVTTAYVSPSCLYFLSDNAAVMLHCMQSIASRQSRHGASCYQLTLPVRLLLVIPNLHSAHVWRWLPAPGRLLVHPL